MLTSRQRIFIILSVVISLISVFLLLYLFVFNKGAGTGQPSGENAEQSDLKENGVVGTQETPGVAKPALTAEPFSEEVYAKQVARIFVERFASYSNQNSNQHLADVILLSTDNMAEWLQTRVLKESNEFEGLTTVVVASEVTKITSQSATVRVETQQTSEKGSEQKISQRGGRVELVKVSNDWKVNGFYWDK